MQRVEKSAGATASETRLRGTSVASEPRSRSSSLNSTDSSSGPLVAPESGKGGQPATQRFSVISSEDFDQELVVKPLRVKKKKRKKTGRSVQSLAGPPAQGLQGRCLSCVRTYHFTDSTCIPSSEELYRE